MDKKKISFGFNKVNKKIEIASKAAKQVELIDCFENQSIKIKDAIETKNEPLVIPIRGSSNKLLDDIIKAKEKRIKTEIKQEENELEAKPDSDLTLDELAARELIREAQNRDKIQTETKVFTLPLNEDKFVAEGASESSLVDYENVPISDYGMAILRGMNWKEGMPIGRRATNTTVLPKIPELRPRGLGLGANKLVNLTKPNVDKNGRELPLISGAFAKIIAGNHKGHYCQVQGLDDENCKVVVKTALSNEVLSLNEFLIAPVTSEEFAKGSRAINNVKYHEYEDRIKDETERRRSRSRVDKSDDSTDRGRSKSRKKSKKKSKSRRRRSESSGSERGRRKTKKGKSKHRSSESGSDSERKSTRR